MKNVMERKVYNKIILFTYVQKPLLVNFLRVQGSKCSEYCVVPLTIYYYLTLTYHFLLYSHLLKLKKRKHLKLKETLEITSVSCPLHLQMLMLPYHSPFINKFNLWNRELEKKQNCSYVLEHNRNFATFFVIIFKQI